MGVDVLLVADQPDIFSLQGLHQLEQVGSAAGKAAEIVDVNRVALSGKFEHGLKLRAIGILARFSESDTVLDTSETEAVEVGSSIFAVSFLRERAKIIATITTIMPITTKIFLLERCVFF